MTGPEIPTATQPSSSAPGRMSWQAWVGFGGLALGAGSSLGLALTMTQLPDVRLLRRYVPTQTTYIYDIRGRQIASLHDEANRESVSLQEISPNLQKAVMAIEDSSFYSHPGLNPIGLARALITNLSSGAVQEGGSTLTMQLAKNLFLGPQRTFGRKLSEALLALRLEQALGKQRILELYLNQIYWGNNLYGAEMAARSYFNKPAAQLTLGESALLAGMIQAPEYYSPFDENNRISPARVARAQTRQRQVLTRMQELGWISADEAAAAAAQPLAWGKVTSYGRSLAPYVSDAVVEELAQQFGRNTVVSGGLRIQTTIDLALQQQAEAIARQAQKDVEQAGLGADQIALVAIDPRTHFIKAMVGGKDYAQSQFNRVFQARRQPGSAFKPLVYYQALASGRFKPTSIIQDSPYQVRLGGEIYQPRNADGSYYGSISLTQALAASRNIPAVKLGQEVGIERVIGLARELGIRSPLKPVASLPLGAGEVTPLELTNAYATFASGGWYAPAQLILQVRDSQGRLLVDNRPNPRRVLDPKATADLTKMLQAVVNGGTGAAAKLDRPVAGKTGTTSDARDIWFIGYVPELVTAVWLGNDNYRPMSTAASGGGFAAPIWRQFMLKALKPIPKPEPKATADRKLQDEPTPPTAPAESTNGQSDRPTTAASPAAPKPTEAAGDRL